MINKFRNIQIKLIVLGTLFIMLVSCGILSSPSGRSGYLNGFQVEDIFPDELTAKLATAAGEGDTEEMDRLIKQGADVNATGLDGYSLLVWPFKMENLEGFKHLLARGTNPDLIYGIGNDSAIIYNTILYDDIDYLKAILEVGANPDLLYGVYTPLLSIAFGSEKLDMVTLLVNSGANINLQTPIHSYSATFISLSNAHFETTHYLLKQGAEYNLEDFKGRSVVTEMFEKRDFLDPDRYKYDQFYSDYSKLIAWFEAEEVDLGFCFNKNDNGIYELCP